MTRDFSDERMFMLLMECAEAALEVPIEAQPQRLRTALASLALAQSAAADALIAALENS